MHYSITRKLKTKRRRKPCSEFQQGRNALRRGLLPRPSWSAAKRAGWEFEGQCCYASEMRGSA